MGGSQLGELDVATDGHTPAEKKRLARLKTAADEVAREKQKDAKFTFLGESVKDSVKMKRSKSAILQRLREIRGPRSARIGVVFILRCLKFGAAEMRVLMLARYLKLTRSCKVVALRGGIFERELQRAGVEFIITHPRKLRKYYSGNEVIVLADQALVQFGEVFAKQDIPIIYWLTDRLESIGGGVDTDLLSNLVTYPLFRIVCPCESLKEAYIGLKIWSTNIVDILYSYFELVLGCVDADLCKY